MSSSSFSMTGGGGATTTCSTLCTPPPFSRRSISKTKPCFSQIFRRDIGLDRLVRVRENVEVVHQLLDELEIFQAELRRQILDDDRRLDVNDLAAILGFGFDFRGFGRPLQAAGGDRCRPPELDRRRRFCARMREIGGRIVRLTDSSVAARFGFGVCGSISETVSTVGFRRRLGRDWCGLRRLLFRRDRRESRLGRRHGRVAGRHLGLFGPIGRCLPVDFGSDPLAFGCLGCSSGLDRSAGASRRRLGRSGGLRRVLRRLGFGRRFRWHLNSLKICSWP